jgi:hypothetical protein
MFLVSRIFGEKILVFERFKDASIRYLAQTSYHR